jgi:plasmid stabilization system protein ParE
MRGYRYFSVGRHLVYYSVNSQEVRITAIIPGAMRQA